MAGEAPENVLEIPVAAIFPNPRQPRRNFSTERIERLAASIGAQGVIQPILVRPHPVLEERYELVAGERRLRAIRLLGRPTVPSLVRWLPDEFLLEVALVENLQRDQLTPIEEAQAYQALMAAHGYTQEALSQRVGRERSTIANMVRLLSLPASIQTDLEEERLSVGHARALLAVGDPARRSTLRDSIVAGGLSVREAERLANQERGKTRAHSSPKSAFEPDPRWEAVRQELENRLGTRVSLHRSSNGEGSVEIEFYSMEDFNRLYDLLLGR